MFEHAVIGIDLDYRGTELTSGSLRAVEQARWLARDGLKRVALVHATSENRYVEVGDAGYVVRHIGVPEGGVERMEALRASLESEGLETRLALREEKPVVAIAREVMGSGADLALLGKHDERETGPRLGSVATKVLRKCPGPVWVVRPQSPPAPRVVMVATDLGAVGATAIRLGADMARHAGGELHVVHAFQVPFEEQWRGEDLPGLKAHFQRAVEAQVAEAGEETTAKVHVACSSPTRGILVGSQELKADLVVMGTVGRGGLPGFLMGNTAEKVLPRIEESILVVKPDDFVCPIPLEE